MQIDYFGREAVERELRTRLQELGLIKIPTYTNITLALLQLIH